MTDEIQYETRRERRLAAERAARTALNAHPGTDLEVAHIPAAVRLSPALTRVEPDPLPPARTPGRARARRPWWRHLLDFAVIALAAALLAVLLKAVAFRAFLVPSESMYPTLMTNDRMLVELVSSHVHPYARGDVVVFEDTTHWLGGSSSSSSSSSTAAPNLLQLMGILPDSTGYIVKRILAVPGETIEGRADGTLLINGHVIPDPYAPLTPQKPFVQTLGAGQFWMMGDNRAGSADSRVHGPVQGDSIVGRAWFLFFPGERAGAVQ